jgi:hypothetical protein
MLRNLIQWTKGLVDNMLVISVLLDIMLGGHCLIMLVLRNFLIMMIMLRNCLIMLMLRKFLIMMIMLRNCLIMIMLRNCLIMLGSHCLIMLA